MKSIEMEKPGYRLVLRIVCRESPKQKGYISILIATGGMVF